MSMSMPVRYAGLWRECFSDRGRGSSGHYTGKRLQTRDRADEIAMECGKRLRRLLSLDFYYSVLREDRIIPCFLTRILLKAPAMVVVSLNRFIKDACAISASALTFYSTLSFIPVVALILAVTRGFGVGMAFEEWLKEQTYTNPDVMEWVMNIAGNALDNMKGGVIAGFGIVLLLWSVFRMLSNTELAMNRIWRVRKGRKLARKFTDYMSVLFIAPILVVLIAGMNVFVMSNLQAYAADEGFLGYAGAALNDILTLMPYVLVWFLFVFLYMFMPMTPVRFRYALAGGIVAGTIFQVVQWFYIRFQVGVSSYNAIYGGLAALPLLFVWLQLSWSIVLWGTELCYIMQNRHFMYREDNVNVQWVDEVNVTFRILEFIAGQYRGGVGGATLADICKKLGMSSGKVRVVLQELVDRNILVEVNGDSDVSYYPAVDFHRLSMADVIIRLSHADENSGAGWKVRFQNAVRQEFSKDRIA